MWLVLAEAEDADAVWAADGLRRRLDDVELVTADTLAGARWRHRVGGARNHVEAQLNDGRTIDSRAVSGVVNRLTGIFASAAEALASDDWEYGAQEWHAFVLGWLQSFAGPVVNPAGPRGLCGPFRYPGEWRLLAHRAGLAAMPYRWGADEEQADECALVVGRDAFVPRSLAGLGPRCARLAALAETPLLEVFLSTRDGSPRVVGATPLPRLRAGGEPLLDALAGLLARTAAAA